LTDLPTDHLVPHERNIRSGVGDLSDLKASIAAVGILQPLLVVPLPVDHPCTVTLDTSDGQPRYQIIVGHRRHAAATELGLGSVPCLLAEDEGEADRVVKMIAENVHRQGLSTCEEAEAYRQLTMLDWTPEDISRVTAKPAERVRDALTLTRLPQQVKAAADQGELDLEQAALLEEFAEDAKTLGRLLARGKGWGLSHAVAEERAKRTRREAAERLRAELVLAGARITPRPKDFGYTSKEAEATTLRDGDGNPLDPQEVMNRPGFAVFVDAQTSPPHSVVYCTDPEQWGYTRTRRTAYVPPEVLAAREAHTQALEVAAEVRMQFLMTTYASAKAAKILQVEALRAVITDPRCLEVPDSFHPDIQRLAGCALEQAATARADRLGRLLVARWLCSAEANLRHVAAGRGWGLDPARAEEYLGRLTDAGYVLSEAEQRVREQNREFLAAREQDLSEEESTQAEDSDDEVGEPGPGGEDDPAEEDQDDPVGHDPSGADGSDQREDTTTDADQVHDSGDVTADHEQNLEAVLVTSASGT